MPFQTGVHRRVPARRARAERRRERRHAHASASSRRRSCRAPAPPRSSPPSCAAARMEGVLDSDTATLLERTLTFSGHTAADVMTPRPAPRVDRRAPPPPPTCSSLARRTGFSRFPVTGEDGVDDVVAPRAREAGDGGAARSARGRAGRRDRDGGAARAGDDDARHAARRAARPRLPDGASSRRVRRHRRRRDARGPASRSSSATSSTSTTAPARASSAARDSLTFPGILRPDELHDQAGVRVPGAGLYETVAGFVVSELGRLPKVGDEVQHGAGHARGAAARRPAHRPPPLPCGPRRPGEPLETSAVAP